jgi:hypothetical protein
MPAAATQTYYMQQQVVPFLDESSLKLIQLDIGPLRTIYIARTQSFCIDGY